MGTWIVRQSGSGPGLRVAVTDLIDVAGLPTTAGSRAVAGDARPAARDAACLAGLRAAEREGRARLAGKANLHELGYGITGINPAFGTPVHPDDPRRVPGGSCSGSAVAVAVGQADVAFGTDTGGSVRIPAACCGVCGLSTTWGRVPLDGVRPLAPSLDTVGLLARDISGLAAGMELLEPGFTAAVAAPRTVGRLAIDADPEIGAEVDGALRKAGFDVRPVAVPDPGKIIAASLTVLDAEAWAASADLVRAAADRIGGDVLTRLRLASMVTQARLAAARAEIARWKAALDGIWHHAELLAAPTLTGFPPLLQDTADMARIGGLAAVVNAVGLPALATPVPSGRRRPLLASVQLIGPIGSEDRLLAAGAVLAHANWTHAIRRRA